MICKSWYTWYTHVCMYTHTHIYWILIVTCITNIFSHSVLYLLIFLQACFDEQMFLYKFLMNLCIFYVMVNAYWVLSNSLLPQGHEDILLHYLWRALEFCLSHLGCNPFEIDFCMKYEIIIQFLFFYMNTNCTFATCGKAHQFPLPCHISSIFIRVSVSQLFVCLFVCACADYTIYWLI